MKSAVLIGSSGGMHGVEAARAALDQALGGRYQLEICDEERYPRLDYGDLAAKDMVIFMPQGYAARPCSGATRALVTYVAWGGCLLSLHCGLITGGAYELDLLHCARFKGHAAYGAMDYLPGPQAGARTRARGAFSLEDEPYTFDFDPMKVTHVLLTQAYAQARWPAAWAHPWAKGKVACVAPGHDGESIRALAPLFTDIADWFSGKAGLAEEGEP